jgi:ribosomal-protein-alanine N-acetyltransferase
VTGVVVRPLRWWDLAVVVDLERRLFPADPWSAELFWGELAGVPRTRHYVIAEDAGGAVLGYAGLAAVGGTADVQTVGVSPQAQGRGIGRRLLGELLGEARRRGCSAVLLEVRADNAAAQHLYAQLGFERISTRRGYYEQGRVDADVLRLRIGREAGDPVAGSSA